MADITQYCQKCVLKSVLLFSIDFKSQCILMLYQLSQNILDRSSKVNQLVTWGTQGICNRKLGKL